MIRCACRFGEEKCKPHAELLMTFYRTVGIIECAKGGEGLKKRNSLRRVKISQFGLF